jgi:glyoxylase I family protein
MELSRNMSTSACRAGTVHHVSFQVNDLTESLKFYEGILGCTRLERPALPVNGAWLQAGATQVHLIEDTADNATDSPPSGLTRRGNHVAFHTDDLDAAMAGFAENGVEVVSSRSGLPQFFVLDPSGNLLEFTTY